MRDAMVFVCSQWSARKRTENNLAIPHYTSEATHTIASELIEFLSHLVERSRDKKF